MRILFATTHKHLPELRGGMEVNTHELAREFISRGHAVGVVCGLAGVGFTGLIARSCIKLLGTIAPCDTQNGYPVWRAWDSVQVVPNVVKAFQPDGIIVQGGAGFDELLRCCLAMSLPVVCYLHTPDRLPLAEDVQANPNLHFVANSQFTRALHPDKAISEVFHPLIRRADYEVQSDRSSAIFVNPALHKGLEVVEQIATARADVPFLFVANRRDRGGGVGGRILECPNVRTIGPFRDMRKVYCRAKLVCMPSQWLETWGRVASEAHFSGIPVLSSDRGGLPEAVGPGGLCLPINAPLDDWLSAFSSIWDDGNRYETFRKAALCYAERPDIDPSVIVASFLKYLNSIL